MAEPNRVPLTVRMQQDDKDLLAEAAGFEVGVAARMVLEVVVRRLRGGESFYQVLGDLEASRAGGFDRAAGDTVRALQRQIDELAVRIKAPRQAVRSRAPARRARGQG